MSDGARRIDVQRESGQFGPTIDKATMDMIEHKIEELAESDGITRRSALAALTQDSDQLRRCFLNEEDAETFATLLAHIFEYNQRLKGLVEMMDAATTRLLVAAELAGIGTEDGDSGH